MSEMSEIRSFEWQREPKIKAFHSYSSYPGQDFAMCAYSTIAAELKSSLLVHHLFWTTLLASLTLGSVNVTSFCAEGSALCPRACSSHSLCHTGSVSLALRLAKREPRARQSSGVAQAVPGWRLLLPLTESKCFQELGWMSKSLGG